MFQSREREMPTGKELREIVESLSPEAQAELNAAAKTFDKEVGGRGFGLGLAVEVIVKLITHLERKDLLAKTKTE